MKGFIFNIKTKTKEFKEDSIELKPDDKKMSKGIDQEKLKQILLDQNIISDKSEVE